MSTLRYQDDTLAGGDPLAVPYLSKGHVARVVLVAACVVCATLVSCSRSSKVPGQLEVVLRPADLYGGLEATRVLLKDEVLILDTRNWVENSSGKIVTDVIDLAADGVLDEQAAVTHLTGGVNAEIVGTAAVTAQARTGATLYQAPGTWSEWRPVENLIQPIGRYVQVRLDLTTKDPKFPPIVKSVTLSYGLQRTPQDGTVTLVSDHVQRIVRSPVSFGYEQPDQPAVARLRKAFHLDDVIAAKKTEFGQLRALMRWVATRPNKRPGPWQEKGEPYPWDIRRVMTDEDGGAIYGHCMSYCEAMITAAAAFGWQGRHWAIHGIRDTSHEVAEIWFNELGKWVYFDPSLDTYYADQETGEPLSLLEMHNLYLKTVLETGELQRKGSTHNEDRLRRLRGKHPITCVTGDIAYGQRAKWDWQWEHGYMTAGWLQLTPRNNWHSRPEPIFQYFGWGPDGYAGFPLYIDEQTPLPTEESSLWYTRKRDLWWTLNQAAFRLIRTGADSVSVECGNSQPFFKRYLARIGDGDWKPVDERFTWTLQSGDNRLEVVPEDEFGKKGLSSAVVVLYEP
jgi:hypothetical protein